MSNSYKNKFKAKHTLVKLGVFALLRAACGGAVINFSEDCWIRDICMRDDYEIACEIFHESSKGHTNISVHIINTIANTSIPIYVSFYGCKIDLTNLCEFSNFRNDFWKKVVAKTPNDQLCRKISRKAGINLSISPFNSNLEMKNFNILDTFVGEHAGNEIGDKAEYEIYHEMKHSSRWACVILMLIRSLIYSNEKR